MVKKKSSLADDWRQFSFPHGTIIRWGFVCMLLNVKSKFRKSHAVFRNQNQRRTNKLSIFNSQLSLFNVSGPSSEWWVNIWVLFIYFIFCTILYPYPRSYQITTNCFSVSIHQKIWENCAETFTNTILIIFPIQPIPSKWFDSVIRDMCNRVTLLLRKMPPLRYNQLRNQISPE